MPSYLDALALVAACPERTPLSHTSGLCARTSEPSEVPACVACVGGPPLVHLAGPTAPPDPPAADPNGPGSILRAYLESWGFSGCGGCDAQAARMDRLGAAGVLADLDAQVAEIHGRAPLVPSALIRNRVEWACRESLRRKAVA